MRRHLFMLLLLAAGSARADYTAFVDPSLVLVTNFEGWGTSLCWWPNIVGGYSNRDTYADLAFKQLKLNIVRYNIGGGENPTKHFLDSNVRALMPGFEPTNGVWNWSADANQRWMLKAALARGVDHVEAFANSPPWWMTISGSVTGNTNGNNLQTNYEPAFAVYLATVVSNLTAVDGVHFDSVTPMNEPNEGWWNYGGSQEGCNMSTDQQVRMVNYLRAELDARGLGAGIAAPEDSYEQDTLNALNLYGAATLSNVSRVVTHTYSANAPAGVRNFASAQHKPLWVSEYGHGDATGMTLARRIHDDITAMWPRAWVYWQVVDNGGGWGLLYNPLVTGTNAGYSTAYTINESFYVMGQFSQFIRPGYQIVSVGDNNSLAAYNPTNGTLVIVALNDSTNGFNVTYDLNAFGSLPTQVSAYRTSATENQALLAPLSLVGSKFTSPLPAKSVTTHVLANVIPAPPGSSARAWYPFEGTAADDSGNGYNGALLGNVTFVQGKMGAQAAQFDGTTAYAQIPLSISNDFTIACWVKTTATGGGSQWWAGKGLVDGEVQGAASDFGLSLVQNKAAFGVGNPDTTITSTNAINDGQWHHLAATRANVSGQMQLFVDGVLQASAIGPTGTRSGPPALRIGSIQAGYAGGFFTGAIDDVQLFGSVLSAPVIGQLMTTAPAVRGWGDNSLGQAGVPVSASNAVAVAAGGWHSLALRSDGTTLAWGDNSAGQCNLPSGLTNVLAISAGGYHSLAIRTDSNVEAWGDNSAGQTIVPAGLSEVIAVAAGRWHSLALQANGTIAAWGDNTSGQISVPTGLSNVVAIAAGGDHSLALRADGTVVAWGDNLDANGNTAGQSSVPFGLSNVVAIAAGDYHSLAAQAGGTVVAWGDNSQGQCSVPAGLSKVVAVAGGGAHSLALKSDGTVAAWGLDRNGQCSLPRTSTAAVGLSAGENHSLVLQVGTQPVPRLWFPALRAGVFTAVVQTLNRTNYVLDFKPSLTETSWSGLNTNPGNGALRLLSDSLASAPQRFYRLRLSP
jgi:O-glycosyl hydrolase